MMSLHVQLIAVVMSAGLLLVVLELVRRRRFLERYALVWMASAVALLVLAAWRPGLDLVAGALGIAYAPSALFLIAGAFVLFLLLHFSIAVSRLTEQSKVLAQRLALLEERQRSGEGAGPPASPRVSEVGERERERAAGRGSAGER